MSFNLSYVFKTALGLLMDHNFAFVELKKRQNDHLSMFPSEFDVITAFATVGSNCFSHIGVFWSTV